MVWLLLIAITMAFLVAVCSILENLLMSLIVHFIIYLSS
jgi:hypothetical protein